MFAITSETTSFLPSRFKLTFDLLSLKNAYRQSIGIHTHSDLRLEILMFGGHAKQHEIVAGDAICVG
jgi:hypothetical protein